MFKIASTGDPNEKKVLYNSDDWDEESETANDDQLRIYFDLEHPISKITFDNDEDDGLTKFAKKYINPLKTPEGDHQVYINSKVNLRTNFHEFISGFFKIQANVDDGDYGIDKTTTHSDINSKQFYTRGYVTLEPVKSFYWLQKKKEPRYFHPLAMLAWQQMKQIRPEILTASKPDVKDYSDASKKQAANAIKDLVGAFGEVALMFKSFHRKCFNKNYANKIDLSASWIRLGTPDKIKFGGGSRVAKVYLNDNWGEIDPEYNNENLVYGQEYDYTTVEGNQTISSGVASFEPMIGANENILRYARIANRKEIFQASSISSFTYPVNEQLYPGPAITYSKVTTRSIGTGKVMRNAKDATPKPNVAKRAVSGVKTNEYYTYNDFPVITKETSIDKDNYKLWVPIPFIGLIQNTQMAASQGYSIELNNMNGKPKSEKTFQVKGNGELGEQITSVHYEYQTEEISYQDEEVFKLDNKVTTVLDELIDDDQNPGKKEYKKEDRLMGVEYDIYPEFRKSTSVSGSAGVDQNSGLILFFFVVWPDLSWIPEFNLSTSGLRTAVVNKVIHKTGILKKVTASDGQSTVTTNNLLYDQKTGDVVLTKVNNNYEEPVYSMNIPAHWKYEGMGAAYENSGITFPFNFTADGDNLTIEYNDQKDDLPPFWDYTNVQKISQADYEKHVHPGDELLIQYDGKAYMGVVTDGNTIYCPVLAQENGLAAFINLAAEAKIIRSSKRNLLSAVAGNIVALDKPTEKIGKNYFGPSLNYYTEKFDETTDQLIKYLHNNIFLPNLTDDKIGSYSNFKGYSILDKTLESIEIMESDVAFPGAINPNYPNCNFSSEPKSAKMVITSKDGQTLTIEGLEINCRNWFSVSTSNNEKYFSLTNYFNTLFRVPHEDMERVFIGPSYETYNNTNALQTSAVQFDDSWTYKEIPNGTVEGVLAKGSTSEKGASYDCSSFWCIRLDNNSDHYYHNPNVWHDYSPEEITLAAYQQNPTTLPPGIGKVTYTDGSFDYIFPPDNRPNLTKCSFLDFTDEIEQLFCQKVGLDDCISISTSLRAILQNPSQRADGLQDVLEASFDVTYLKDENYILNTPTFTPIRSISIYNIGHSHFWDFDIATSTSLPSGNWTPVTITDELPDNINVNNLNNPYLNGEKGIWRVLSNSYYKDERISSNSKEQYADDEHNLSADGVFQGESVQNGSWDKTYYFYDWSKDVVNHENWVPNEQITKYNRDGFAIESKDILGNYSFAKYGYGGNLVTMVGANAQENEVFFEDFEDPNSTSVIYEANIDIKTNDDYSDYQVYMGHTGNNSAALGGTITFSNSDITLKPGKEYILSAWVTRTQGDLMRDELYPCGNNNVCANLSYIGTNSSDNWITSEGSVIKPFGPAIEGWRQYGSTFRVPDDYIEGTDFNVALYTGNNGLIFDDFKICPKESATKSYVYDPETFRLVAELDNNNFAIYYYYDSQGSLYLTKVETSEGVMTVSESRGHVKEEVGQ